MLVNDEDGHLRTATLIEHLKFFFLNIIYVLLYIASEKDIKNPHQT